MSPIEKLEKERLLDDFVKVDRLNITAYGENFDRLLVTAKDAVCVLVKNTDSGLFYFVNQLRACKHKEVDPTTIEVVAGMLESREQIEIAVRRECIEEIGYDITNLQFWGSSFSAPGIVTEKMYFFYAETNDNLKKNEGGGLDAEHENIKILTFTEEQLWNRLQNGEWEDTKTVVLVQRYFLEKLSTEGLKKG